MRDSLTVLAIALIFVLTAALVGPYLVDWSAQRGWIEARLSETIGVKTKIRGPIDLKLLPSPYFVVEDMVIGGDAGGKTPGFALSAKKLRLEISPAALLRGEVDFVEARLEAPRLAFEVAPDGAAPLSLPDAAAAGRFRFEKIAVANGVLHVDDIQNNRHLNLDGINFEAEAESLAGPFKGSGAFGAGDSRTPFHFATGAIEKGELNLKLVAKAGVSHPGADLDGRLSLRPGAQRFTGAAIFDGAAPSPWRASGQLILDASGASLDQIALRIGGEAHEIGAKGQAEVDFSANPKASATLASDEVDLDAWRAAAVDSGAGLEWTNLAWTSLPGFPPLPFTLTYGLKTLIFGGATFEDVSTNLVFGQHQTGLASEAKAGPQQENAAKHPDLADPSAWLRFEAHGPERSRLFLDGQWRIGAEPAFEGEVQASAEDARWLKQWIVAFAPQWTPEELPFRAIDLSARTNLSPTALKLRDLVAQVDGSHVSGTLDYRLASGSERARLDADLATPALDLSGVANFDLRGLLTRIFGASDGSLRLDAAAITLGHAEAKTDSVGGLDFDLVKTGEKTELNELTFEGQDGAVVTASGLLSPQNAHLDAKIVAPRGSGLVAALAKIAPQPAEDFISSRTGLLTPIDVNLTADAAEKDAIFAVTSLAARGSVGGAGIEASVKNDDKQPGNMMISALAQAKDSLPLLRLLGLASAPTPATRRGAAPSPSQIEIKAQGPLGKAAQTAIKASLGSTSLTFQGEIVTDLAQPAARGSFHFSSPDAAPMLRATGLVFPDFAAKAPATAGGDLTWTKTEFGIANLKAEVAGTSFSGALGFGEDAKRLTGSIDVSQMPAAALFGLVLGPPEPAKAGSLWSSLAFAPTDFELPNAKIALTVKDLAFPASIFQRDVSAKDARATLLTGPGLMDLQDVNLDMDGGKLAGAIRLRRTAGDASLEGQLDFADLALDGRAARGRFSGGLDFAGAGKSADAIAASLAGSGRALVSDLVVPQADPAAVARVFATFDQEGHELGASDVAAALSTELKRADFKLKSSAFDIAIAAGMLHLSPKLEPASENPGNFVSASFDLRRATLTQRLSLVLNPPPKKIDGPAPQINLVFQGSLSSPAVQIDAAALANTLAARAIQRESARIESYEFDIHERAFFYQRLLSERRREAERLKAEAEATQKPPNSAD